MAMGLVGGTDKGQLHIFAYPFTTPEAPLLSPLLD